MPQPTRRLFVGLVLDGPTAQQLEGRVRTALEGRNGECPRGVRAYPARDLHLTLAFLGQFPARQVPRLGRGLGENLRGLAAPELKLAGTGAFPDPRGPRVLWAGVECSGRCSNSLTDLREQALGAALDSGWRSSPDLPFRPHVTVARVRPGAPPVPPAFFDLDVLLGWQPAEVCLLESRPQNPGARYVPLHRFPLDPGPA
jgi:RNA 2',3'-cyclic 3'-phosphodiesterase